MPRAVKRRAENAEEKEVKPKKMKNSGNKKKETLIELPNLRSLTKTAGVVLTFGQGDVGQLGLGEDVMEKMKPALVETEKIISIAAGGMHSVLLTDAGKVITFGCNDEGALGRDTSKEGTECVPGPVDLPGKVIQITAGDSHSAALLEDGRVYAWGSFRDSHGSMGLTTTGNEKLPIELMSFPKIVKLSSGADHLVLLSENGKVFTCGCAEQGQLGRMSIRTADRDSRYGVKVLLKPEVPRFSVRVKNEFKNIWAGTSCTFAQDVKNKMYVFGLNNYHQIGLERPDMYFLPTLCKPLSGNRWVHISSAQHHTLALDDNGKVYVLGRKEYGRLGLGEKCDDAEVPTQVLDLDDKNCIDISASSNSSFAVTHSGELYSWGMGSNGQLGTGNENDVFSPTLVKGKQLEGKSVARVSGGGQHTIILATVK